jgi:hypothetical protein
VKDCGGALEGWLEHRDSGWEDGRELWHLAG